MTIDQQAVSAAASSEAAETPIALSGDNEHRKTSQRKKNSISRRKKSAQPEENKGQSLIGDSSESPEAPPAKPTGRARAAAKDKAPANQKIRAGARSGAPRSRSAGANSLSHATTDVKSVSVPVRNDSPEIGEGKKNRRRGRRTPKIRQIESPGREQPVDMRSTMLDALLRGFALASSLDKRLALPAAPRLALEAPSLHLPPVPQKLAKPAATAPLKQSKKRMFISVLPGEQVEVGIAEDGALLEYYLDMLHQRKIKGNIYKGVIHNIDSNLQAAFVNYGADKNGFLQIDEVHPEYWQAPAEGGKDKKFPPIQKALHAGQEVLVQVVKEPSGAKGAFLTTWLSLAGRFLVLTPGQEQIGVSRKVTDPDERARLREMMNGIDPGAGFGAIVRTVGEGATKSTLKNDLQYLKRLWRDIRKKATEVAAPALLHQEPGLSERAVRDYLTDDVLEVWVDNEEEAKNVKAMANLLFPRKKDLVHLHSDLERNLWEKFHLLPQLEQIYSREVSLPSGGRLVFDQTEALMAVDINSGKISGKGNFEAMAFKTNMEASEAIARQLRLRDIGGQVVIDFIEMRDKKHVLEVEKNLRKAMKTDRARHDVGRMSTFGLLELVRQRMGSSALSISMETCSACGGTGLRRNLEWQAMQALKDIRLLLKRQPGYRCVYETGRELGMYLLNHKRDALRTLEKEYGKILEITVTLES